MALQYPRGPGCAPRSSGVKKQPGSPDGCNHGRLGYEHNTRIMGDARDEEVPIVASPTADAATPSTRAALTVDVDPGEPPPWVAPASGGDGCGAGPRNEARVAEPD